jgi:hypothetical protein
MQSTLGQWTSQQSDRVENSNVLQMFFKKNDNPSNKIWPHPKGSKSDSLEEMHT